MSEEFSDREEVLLRHVPPAFFREERLSSQAFEPGSNDDGQLSVARGSLTTAEAAFALRVSAYGKQPAGTWGVSVGECEDAALKVRPDPLTSPPEPVADPAHALVDFRGLSRRQSAAKAQILVGHARLRGRLHPR